MIVTTLADIQNSERNVKSQGWESARLLLKRENMGFSFHITTIYAGAELPMHYQNHLESVYIIRGEGNITDLANGQTHALRPGTLYALDQHDRHILRGTTEMVCACVFNPPVSGQEVHDASGAYPADLEAAEA
jgi:L-ectoine synthase